MQWKDNEHSKSCRMEVFQHLLDGQWHINSEFEGDDKVGGQQGTRRAREIRQVLEAQGWGTVENRRRRDPTGRKKFIYEYRMLLDDTVPKHHVWSAVHGLDLSPSGQMLLNYSVR